MRKYCCGRSKSLLLCNQTDYTSDEPNISSTSVSATRNTPHRPPCPPPLTIPFLHIPLLAPVSTTLTKKRTTSPSALCHVHLRRKVNPATFTTENHRVVDLTNSYSVPPPALQLRPCLCEHGVIVRIALRNGIIVYVYCIPKFF
jgi:hypothetical protein